MHRIQEQYTDYSRIPPYSMWKLMKRLVMETRRDFLLLQVGCRRSIHPCAATILEYITQAEQFQ